jgi:hypothetical protein
MITIDMTRAREIWRDKIRLARNFAPLDLAFQRAQETGADIRAIVAAKQALRDAPDDPRIEVAATLDELKAVWPDCLKG